MKVFHGSTAEIQYPLANIGRENLDFGKGTFIIRQNDGLLL